MAKHTNNEFFNIGNSKTVSVTMTFIVDIKADEAVVLRNAGEAAKWLANTGTLHSWVKSIDVKE